MLVLGSWSGLLDACCVGARGEEHGRDRRRLRRSAYAGFPSIVAKQGPECEIARFYAEMAKHVDAVSPDVLIIFTDDHFNTFFLDNFPTFAIGIADATSGPNDQTPMPRYKVGGDGSRLAAHVRARAIADGFDISLVQDFEVDHSIMVPLHFLTPHMRIR